MDIKIIDKMDTTALELNCMATTLAYVGEGVQNTNKALDEVLYHFERSLSRLSTELSAMVDLAYKEKRDKAREENNE
ncbi:MAG: hypothetical protein RR198_08290 [Oscillospiraceae bacterium]